MSNFLKKSQSPIFLNGSKSFIVKSADSAQLQSFQQSHWSAKLGPFVFKSNQIIKNNAFCLVPVSLYSIGLNFQTIIYITYF